MVQQLVARGASMLALDAHGRCDEEPLQAGRSGSYHDPLLLNLNP